MDEHKLSLSELNNQVKETIQDNFFESIWVVAEIGELNINRNGHAYLELVEKEEHSDKIIAKARATIWSYTLRMLKPYFETTTKQELTAGLKVLVNVSVEFHEIYGFSLNVRDIDPTYTLGDLEKRRLEIISRLEEEGTIDLNKELDLPPVIQKVAIISSATAAGYEDFFKQLSNNPYKYKFYTRLFPAIMQGEQTESSIIDELDKIYQYEDFFDVVVIIRGGGSRSDLMSFDKYFLAANIAQFPLPVISGIGHEKDVSIVDMVSHTSLKTPTAVAEFLIANIAEFEDYLDSLFENVSSFVLEKLSDEQKRIELISRQFVPDVQNRLFKEKTKLTLIREKLYNESNQFINRASANLGEYQRTLESNTHFSFRMKSKSLEQLNEKLTYRAKNQLDEQLRKLNYFEKAVSHLDPRNVLKKGYSITKYKGKPVINATKLKLGDEIETILFEGEVVSKVKLAK
ncbi:MAG: exodeoxyribonuclease VII large subunit [Bacteroidetes bacterium]|nr:MAG: exodeoxyribonuclease VII large subunit [Bacteroidota bacterium]